MPAPQFPIPLLAATLTCLVAGCVGSEEIIYDVQHYRVPCLKQHLELCPLLKADDERDFAVFSQPINGFSPTWGESQRIRVVRRETVSPGTEPVVSYDLDTVLKTTPVDPGTVFTYRFRLADQDDGHPGFTLDGAGGGELLDGSPFTCAPATVCDTLATYDGANGTATVSLRYADPTSGPFEAFATTLE